jgi:hypothetical protein
VNTKTRPAGARERRKERRPPSDGLSPTLRKNLELAAKYNRRSISQEIEARLVDSFGADMDREKQLDPDFKGSSEILSAAFHLADSLLLSSEQARQGQSAMASAINSIAQSIRDFTASQGKHAAQSYFKDSKLPAEVFLEVDQFTFKVRTRNLLKGEGIVYIGDLVQKTEFELQRVPNLGRTTVNDILQELSIIGLGLGVEVANWETAKKQHMLAGPANKGA